MKVTKQGIILYEDGDKAPSASSATDQCLIMINMLRIEMNKMALIIEKQQEEIDALKAR